MAYQNVRSAPEFKYSNRTLGGGQWDSALKNEHALRDPRGLRHRPVRHRTSQSGNIGNAELRRSPTSATTCTASPSRATCSRRRRDARARRATAAASPTTCPSPRAATSSRAATTTSTTWSRRSRRRRSGQNPQKKVAIVLMFDEGNATAPDLNSCCGWKAGKTVDERSARAESGRHLVRRTRRTRSTARATRATARASSACSTNQPTAPKGIVGQRRRTATSRSCARCRTCSASPIRRRTRRT